MLTLTLNTLELQYIASQAKQTAYGGKSAVRATRGDTLHIDQLIGHIGEYAGSLYLFGSPDRYYQQRMYSRELRKKDIKLGDGGQDIVGLNLDFKTSKQFKDRSPIEHTLAVRPKEFKQDWVYMLMIVMSNNGHEIDINSHVNVSLVGWASSDMFPKNTANGGVFEGAYTLRGSQLKPVMPVRWDWRKYQ